MTYLVLTIVFVIVGGLYLIRRKKDNAGFPEILGGSKEPKLSIDEAFNLEQKQKKEQLDKLLDKINRKGMDSLNTREKEQLKELSK